MGRERKPLVVKSRITEQTSPILIAALYQIMINHQDEINAAKLSDIYEKSQQGELVISFAGHFSAGKSSMINALLGEEILPKSPIPTSANIVKLTSGKGIARVFFKEGRPEEYHEPYDMEMIKQYTKDKEAIKKIEISTAKQLLPPGTALVDTPGIDAADDADRVITESSLHLVDHLFYIMDYNHVQSEVNLVFLQNLQKQRTPYSIIINQIDKHDETEIAFSAFEKSVKQTFDQWELKPTSVFYSSLKEQGASHNQFPAIQQTVNEMMKEKESHWNIDASVKQVVREHEAFLQSNYEEMLAEYEEEAISPIEALFLEKEELKRELMEQKNEPADMGSKYKQELNNTLKNAYLMPADLRDKAERFLVSQEKNFKVGIFASKKKTTEERKARTDDFLMALQENIEAAVQWKLRDKLLQVLNSYQVDDPSLQKRLQDLKINYTIKDLQRLLKPGAKLNGDYLLNYTNDIAADVKRRYKQKANDIWTAVEEAVCQKNRQFIKETEDRLSRLEHLQKQSRKRSELQSQWKEARELLHRQYSDPTLGDSGRVLIEEVIRSRSELVIKDADTTRNNKRQASPKQDKIASKPREENKNQTPAEKVRQSVNETLKIINDLPGFNSFVPDLHAKEESLANRSYTIALFGAFSAGKSSFANALLGDTVLAVSPNPTTAAVTRIRPVTAERRHGTAVITLKDEDSLRTDLLEITKHLSPSEKNLNGMLNWISEEKIDQSETLSNMHQTYLQAVIAGYPQNKENIGETITVSQEAFASYVTDETKACYIDSVDFYYDCSVTRKGITLVDTPGADSVNARHTNVSFDYIKHADAILYVTYYNHALSRADKDFLMQLGRVKDAFAMDKMFFIVNAADLAADHQELKLVTNYVQEQLLLLGIRLPRLFPVSSKQAVKEKKLGQSLNANMEELEREFFGFIHNDLQALTVQSAIEDIRRADQALKDYMKTIQLDAAEKEDHRQELLRKKVLLEQVITGVETDLFSEQIKQKTEKQVYYIHERLSIRYHDMFKESFNPTTITESGKKAVTQLKTALQQLIDYAGREIKQELQAVSLRLESYIASCEDQLQQRLAKSSRETDETFKLPEITPADLETPSYQRAFQHLELTEFAKILAGYRGTKAFFVNNEKEQMKEQIFTVLSDHMKAYLQENQSLMQEHYQKQWNRAANQKINEAWKRADEHITRHLEMMDTPADMEFLQEKQQMLQEITNQYKEEEMG
ncbi:dynamin family protein [Lentibacillus sediminis]|uniref:dynamin family protein n=1 Tax=Lentibacillus sediminis TaxID=1940529 RepID=UPI000C1BF592|nr:dynamin family protein [Lentibacillus sediminis]